VDWIFGANRALELAGVNPDSKFRRRLHEVFDDVSSRFRWNLYRPVPSYSQFGEDVVLRAMLGDAVGTYVDVGAGDPIRSSNTFSLYRQGWRGTLIDPISSNVGRARKFRKRDKVIQAACGAESGEVTFFEYTTYEYSTTSLERVEELSKQGLVPCSTYTVPIIPLRELNLVARPDEPSILSIDVEGSESEVIAGIDWNVFRPRFILVEEWSSPLRAHTTIFHELREQGYVLAAFTGLTSIYSYDA
jgi:FkbM family methyltransferase